MKDDTAYWNLSQEKKNAIAGNDSSWRSYLTDLTGIWTYNYMVAHKMDGKKNK